MKTYTEKEIKEWFEAMKKEYPNSNTLQHLEHIERMMFGKTWERDSIEYFLNKKQEE